LRDLRIAIQPPVDQSSATDGGQPAICLVDDDPLVLKSLRNLLASDGIATCCFDRPESFLAHIETHPAVVVVLDIWMESMTGIELLALLRAESPQTRVILITGHEDPATAFSLTQAGASALLVKPFEDEQLLSLVRRELRSREGERAANDSSAGSSISSDETCRTKVS
jgi:DNA-binding NtrC family response regulator